ncbi:uncharacterized protein N7500_008515 [Penicillium coprophilum]|uniref:uncharacterized protein n=1 Tax=Penicillium coprophilum TaxID=36646 RepID=UPI0023994FD9|nr:uncharacterized protein N7500_008515 [Penicillium coprophilum]KAJ5158864.1 hypothetical protein N7500_008515 [Penicillium coprophilum]
MASSPAASIRGSFDLHEREMARIQALKRPARIHGEEVIAERLIAKTRAQVWKQKRQNNGADVPVLGLPGTDEWNSDSNNYESEDDTTSVISSGYESADAHQEPTGSVRSARPFAVVIPPLSEATRQAMNRKAQYD